MCMEIQQITDQNKPEENSFRSGILHVLELVLLAFHVPHLRLLLHSRGAASSDIFARYLAAHQRIWN